MLYIFESGSLGKNNKQKNVIEQWETQRNIYRKCLFSAFRRQHCLTNAAIERKHFDEQNCLSNQNNREAESLEKDHFNIFNLSQSRITNHMFLINLCLHLNVI